MHADILEACLRLKSHVAALRLSRACRRVELRLRYSPDQPRVPVGNPDGGQWTNGSEGNGDQSTQGPRRIQLAADITGFTKHDIDQAISRGVSPSAILDAVKNSSQIIPQANGTTRFVGSGAVVVLNPLGQVVTVWGQ